MMDSKKTKYFVLYSYVYFRVIDAACIFYNTIDGTKLICNDKIVINFLKTQITNNDFKIHISYNTNDPMGIKSFLKKLINLHMGLELIENENADDLALTSRKTEILFKDQIVVSDLYRRSNLFQVDIHLNTTNCTKLKLYTKIHKQIKAPIYDTNYNEIDIEPLSKFIKTIQNSSVTTVNFICGYVTEIYKYKNIFDGFLQNVKKVLIINFFEIIDNISFIQSFTQDNPDILLQIQIIVNKVEVNLIKKIIDLIDGKDIILEFLVEDNNSLEILLKNNILNFPNTIISPYYNYNNIDFFKEHVFINKDSILENTVPLNEIQANQLLNYSKFGRFIITSDGNIKSSFFNKNIGNIYNSNLDDITFKLHSEESGWFLKRSEVEPCKNCLYCDLCPSIGNYEHIIGKYNLCDII